MRDLNKEDKQYVLNTYKRLDLNIVSGEGVYLYDSEGNKYLDMYSGISVNNLGHDKEIVKAITKQAEKYIHLSNYFVSEPTVNLAKLLVENSFADKVFFANSGSESNEAAIKLCRKYGKSKSENKTELLSALNSFHGRTLGSLTLTAQEKYQKSFKPLIGDVNHFVYNDIESLRNAVSDRTCGVFIEIIQGEGGIREVTKEFISELVALSKKHDFLIVIDEVQTGIGRCGDLFAYEKFDFTPDLVSLSKSLGGGIPLGALLISERLKDVLVAGDHGTTFGGNPVAAAAGEYVVNKVVNTNLCNEVKEKGSMIVEKVSELKEKYPNIINDIRGRGLMIGIDVGDYANLIKDKALEEYNLLLNVTNGTVVRLLPSLCITKEEIEIFLTQFEEIISNL